MNSALYECRLSHARLSPRRHEFEYPTFLFAIDLTETEEIKKLWLFRLGFVQLRESDYISAEAEPIIKKLGRCLREKHGFHAELGGAVLVTQLRTAGYTFNPVSFFFCYDRSGRPLAVLAEVNNTFGENKTYLVPGDSGVSDQTKDFYISPFVGLKALLKLRLPFPNDEMSLHIQTVEDGRPVLVASLIGRRVKLTNASLLRNCIRFPLVGLTTIARIHWNALMLYLKRVPYHAKETDLLKAKSADGKAP